MMIKNIGGVAWTCGKEYRQSIEGGRVKKKQNLQKEHSSADILM